MDKINSIKYLENELRSLSGFKILQEMDSIKDSIYVLNTNFYELDHHINELKEFSNKLNTRNLNLETKRLVHNYLCSAVTLIDHTRIYISNIHQEKEFLDYQPKINEIFVQNPLCTFIKDFRQYLQHFKLPEISFQTNTLSIKSNWSIKIKTDELLKFSGWKHNSKIFIKSQIITVDLHKVINEYQKIVTDFYEWLIKRQNEIFFEEITELEEKKYEIKKIRINNLIIAVLSKEFIDFDSFENEFYIIFGRKEYNFLNSKNPIEKIKKMINILQIEKKLKVEFQELLESLLL